MIDLFKMTVGATNAIVASTTSQTRALPAAGGVIVFYNDGPNLVFCTHGNSGCSAAAPGLSTNTGAAGMFPIPVGQMIPKRMRQGATHWAVVAVAGAANVYCSVGE